MCDFHDRLVAEVRKLDGVSCVCLLPRGKAGAGRGFHRHPHIAITLINGRTFEHTIKNRPKDTWRRFLNYLCAIRRRVWELLGSSRPMPSTLIVPKKQGLKRRRKAPVPRPSAAAPEPPPPRVPTRLDLDPWAPLRALRVN